jgi:hypothetical protein
MDDDLGEADFPEGLIGTRPARGQTGADRGPEATEAE